MKNRAFTLLEALITGFMIFLMFSTAAALLSKSFDVVRSFQGHGNLLEAAGYGLDRICCEAREAILVSEPALEPEPGVDHFDFLKMNPAQQLTRFPNPLPSPLPAGWTMQDPAQELKISYRLDKSSQTLVRQLTPATGGNALILPVCAGVTNFGCFWRNGELCFQMTVQVDQNIVRSLSAQVVCLVNR